MEELVTDADAVIATYNQVGRLLIERMDDCKIIARNGIGYDVVDV